jgi:hypothetical protein
MWIKEIGMLYEGWGPSSPNLPGDSRATLPPQETKDSVRMKGIFGSGDSPANMASLSQASGQNPYEQEEDKALSKSKVLLLIDYVLADLDSNNNLDKSGVMALTTLKNKIKKL